MNSKMKEIFNIAINAVLVVAVVTLGLLCLKQKKHIDIKDLEVRDRDEEISKLEADNKKLEKQNDDLSKFNQKLLSGKGQEISELKADNKKLEEQNNNLIKANRELVYRKDEEISELKEENKKLEKQNDDLIKFNRKLVLEQDKLEEKNNELQKRNDNLIRVNQGLQMTILADRLFSENQNLVTSKSNSVLNSQINALDDGCSVPYIDPQNHQNKLQAFLNGGNFPYDVNIKEGQQVNDNEYELLNLENAEQPSEDVQEEEKQEPEAE